MESWERRDEAIGRIVDFVHHHPESYASLAVCRRALDVGLDRVTGTVLSDLQQHLGGAPDGEVEAYFYIVK